MNKMTAAATMPISVLLEGGVCWICLIALPPSSTSRPDERADFARSMTACTSALGSACAILEKVMFANAVRPSLLSWAAPAAAYGLATEATDGDLATRSSIEATLDWTAGSWTLPLLTWMTIVSESPAWAGKLELSRVSALLDSVPGNEKLSEYAVPMPEVSPTSAAMAASQLTTTMRRCRKHHRARLAKIDSLGCT